MEHLTLPTFFDINGNPRMDKGRTADSFPRTAARAIDEVVVQAKMVAAIFYLIKSLCNGAGAGGIEVCSALGSVSLGLKFN